MQNFIFYLVYIINLIAQDFIVALKFETIIDKVIFHLNNEKIRNIRNSMRFSDLIKKIFIKMIMQKSNAFVKFNLNSLFYDDYQYLVSMFIPI